MPSGTERTEPEPRLVEAFTRILEERYPGVRWRLDREKLGLPPERPRTSEVETRSSEEAP